MITHAFATGRAIAATKPRHEGTPAPGLARFWSRAALSPRGQRLLGYRWCSVLVVLAVCLGQPHVATAAEVVGTGTSESAGRLRLVQVIDDRVDGVEGLFGARAVAVSPDGAQVYAAGVGNNEVAVFARDATTGMLTPVEVTSVGLPRSRVFVSGNPGGVRLSPDGAHLYDLHVPASYDGSQEVPLVVDFHGLRSNPARTTGLFGFRTLADTAGFIVAYPLGLFGKAEAPEAETNEGPSFNAGWCYGQAATARVDDVGFARALVAAISTEARIDRTRVYGSRSWISNRRPLLYTPTSETAS